MKQPLRQTAAAILLVGFLLGVKNGQVALWKDDKTQPIRVFPWYVSLFPQQIQKALLDGIFVEEESDMGKLIQNMIS